MNNLTGRMKSGTVSAIVSSDVLGTVALLETLSNRTSASRYRHLYKLDVRLNDKFVDTHQFTYRRRVTYLPTGDAILPAMLTVREALIFHARMSRMSSRGSHRTADKLVANLKLANQEHKLISELTLPEKARARVAIALVSRPAALLLDSPLFGLDVYEAFQTIAVLKQVAVDLNIAVLVSVSQPSSEVLFTLDKVTFLSKGAVVYAGKPNRIVPYFLQLGYSCPKSYSPSDFLLFLLEVIPVEEHDRLVSSWGWQVGNALDQEMQTNETPGMLNAEPDEAISSPSSPRSQPLSPKIMADLTAIERIVESDDEGDEEDEEEAAENGAAAAANLFSPPVKEKPANRVASFFGDRKSSSSRVNFFHQFWLLYKRELVFLRRSWGTVVVRLLLLSVLCGVIALMLYSIGDSAQQALGQDASKLTPDEISNRMNNYYGAISVMVIIALFGQVEGISVAIPSIRLLFLAEHAFASFYGSFVFFLAQLLIELPLTFVHALIQVSIVYWIVGFVGSWIDWVSVVFCAAVATSSLGWLISCISRTPLVALQLIPIVLLPQLLFSGLLTDLEMIPSWLKWMEYLCYLKYCINLGFLVEAEQYMSMNPVPTPIQFLADQNSIKSVNISTYVWLIVFITVGCRLLALFALYYYRTRRYLKL